MKNIYKQIFLLISLLLLNLTSSSQCRLDKSNYTLVINEEFDTYSGNINNLLGNSSIWKCYPDEGLNFGWGSEYYPNQNQLSLISDGKGGHLLRLKAEKLSSPLTLPNGRRVFYKSGMIMLKNSTHNSIKFGPFDNMSAECDNLSDRGFIYGMFEIRCKIPEVNKTKQDTWPTFWLISRHSEIDILDNNFNDNSRIYESNLNDWTILPWSKFNTSWTATYGNTSGLDEFNHSLT